MMGSELLAFPLNGSWGHPCCLFPGRPDIRRWTTASAGVLEKEQNAVPTPAPRSAPATPGMPTAFLVRRENSAFHLASLVRRMVRFVPKPARKGSEAPSRFCSSPFALASAKFSPKDSVHGIINFPNCACEHRCGEVAFHKHLALSYRLWEARSFTHAVMFISYIDFTHNPWILVFSFY